MSSGSGFLSALAIGIGATAFMDAWGLLETRLFGLPRRDFTMVGRWLGHMRRGRLRHDGIGRAEPIAGEAAIGWAAHYATGIAFAALLTALCGIGWAQRPTPLPALMLGLATVALPLFVMQPAFGMGIAASCTPRPWIARLKSLDGHLAFGVGLYLAAELVSLALPGP